MTLKERLEILGNSQTQLLREWKDVNERLDNCSAQIMRGMMLELAEENPTIESFSFEGEMVYDDEGSYFWVSSITWEPAGDDFEPWETVGDLEHAGGEAAHVIAFEAKDKWAGTITVARLQELWDPGAPSADLQGAIEAGEEKR